MNFPRTSQEAFGIRFQVSDFEEEHVSYFTVAAVIIVATLGAILWLG